LLTQEDLAILLDCDVKTIRNDIKIRAGVLHGVDVLPLEVHRL